MWFEVRLTILDYFFCSRYLCTKIGGKVGNLRCPSKNVTRVPLVIQLLRLQAPCSPIQEYWVQFLLGRTDPHAI